MRVNDGVDEGDDVTRAWLLCSEQWQAQPEPHTINTPTTTPSRSGDTLDFRVYIFFSHFVCFFSAELPLDSLPYQHAQQEEECVWLEKIRDLITMTLVLAHILNII